MFRSYSMEQGKQGRPLSGRERPPKRYVKPDPSKFEPPSRPVTQVMSTNSRYQPKLLRQKLYPQDSPPKTIYLPYLPPDKDFGRYVETDSSGLGNHMRMIRSCRLKPSVPGWLIAIENEYLSAISKMRQNLGSIKDPCKLIDSLEEIIRNSLELEISKQEIGQVLMNIPYDEKTGPSFPHFMYCMANYEVACQAFRKAYGIEDNIPDNPPNENLKCSKIKCQEDSNGTKGGGAGSKSESGKDETDKPKKKGYSIREMVFYSGLLIFEMYRTLDGVEKLYFQSTIPETQVDIKQRNNLNGINPDSSGLRKKSQAEWDKPLRPLPKLSPYATSMPFVTTRVKIQKPCPDEMGRQKSIVTIQPLHLLIQPPRKQNQPIRITENRNRIKKALRYLAANGDCVALLPNIYQVIHLSDTFIDKLEDVTIKPADGAKSCKKQKVYYNNELAWIAHHAKDLYHPHGIPLQIAGLKPLLKYTDGLHLRIICKHIQKQHWAYISNRKLDYREEAWYRMHVENIRRGPLKESFIYIFVTYLPYYSHLPILHDQNMNPY